MPPGEIGGTGGCRRLGGSGRRGDVLQGCSSAAAHTLQPALSSQLPAMPGGGPSRRTRAAEPKDALRQKLGGVYRQESEQEKHAHA